MNVINGTNLRLMPNTSVTLLSSFRVIYFIIMLFYFSSSLLRRFRLASVRHILHTFLSALGSRPILYHNPFIRPIRKFYIMFHRVKCALYENRLTMRFDV